MELQKSKPIIISAGIGGWYAKGCERLERSLNFHGWAGETKTWKDEYPPNCPPHNDIPYYMKIAAFDWAIENGYTHILWLDASFWAIKNPMPLFDYIDHHGYYLFRSGYSMAQSINDFALSQVGLDRDDLVDSPEYASGCVGFNLRNDDARGLYGLWKRYMDQGLSKGSRSHDGQSQDPRFLWHRQDQSCLTLAMHYMKLSINEPDYVAYYGTGYDKEKVIFFINGL